MTNKLYAKRTPSELQPWFTRHMEAMTVEGLHRKGDIAMELSFRDKKIDILENHLNVLIAIMESQQSKIDQLMLEYCPEEMDEAQLENWANHQCVKGKHVMKFANLEHDDFFDIRHTCVACGKTIVERP